MKLNFQATLGTTRRGRRQFLPQESIGAGGSGTGVMGMRMPRGGAYADYAYALESLGSLGAKRVRLRQRKAKTC